MRGSVWTRDRTISSTWSSVASMLSRSAEEVALELLPKAAAPTASARIACMLYISRKLCTLGILAAF